jgi:hypothetical protein
MSSRDGVSTSLLLTLCGTTDAGVQRRFSHRGVTTPDSMDPEGAFSTPHIRLPSSSGCRDRSQACLRRPCPLHPVSHVVVRYIMIREMAVFRTSMALHFAR